VASTLHCTIFFFLVSGTNGHPRCDFFTSKPSTVTFTLASILKGQNSASFHSGYPIILSSHKLFTKSSTRAPVAHQLRIPLGVDNLHVGQLNVEVLVHGVQ
ncbi:unnamed protein product, partial [Ectocarpus sp. 13 AM-2016]